MPTDIKGFLKDESGNRILPGTTADKVIMTDSDNLESTVLAEVVKNRVAISALAGLKTLNIKGGVNGTTTNLPASGYAAGDVYFVEVAGTYAGKVCEANETLLCKSVSTPASNDDWIVLQINLVNAVTGPETSVVDNVMLFNSVTGNVSKDSGISLSQLSTAVGVGSALDSNKTQLAKIGEDNDGDPTYQGVKLNKVGLPVVENGSAAPANLLGGGIYFEKDAVAAGN